MNKENIQMVAAVAVLLLLSFFNNPASDLSAEPETAIIVESIDEEVMDDAMSPEAVVEEPEPHETTTEENLTEIPDLLESFDEDDLEEEFGNVQTGIDLLNNPLQ